VTFWAIVGLVAILVYALSFGPVAWLLAHAVPPAAVGIVLLFYMPLIIAAETTKPTKDLLQRYVHLWADNLAIGVWD
jgi:hypothetical protein